MVLDFFVENETLLLKYSPETENISWLSNDNVTIKKTFHFTNSDLVRIDEHVPYAVFKLGVLDIEKKYFIIDGNKLNIPISISFDSSIKFKKEYFIAIRDISIFKRIANVVKSDIIIGKGNSANLQIETFRKLIKYFPNTTEITRYANMRIATIVREELDSTIDADAEFEKYLNYRSRFSKQFLLPQKITENESVKYQYIYDRLNGMIQTQEKYMHDEKLWQHEILKVIQIIFPKYISVMEEVTICDVYTKQKKRLDYLLVDFNGNVDIIEIKRPNSDPILKKITNYNNYVPLRKLTDTIMQVEKYIYYLNKWSITGETKLTLYREKKGMSKIEIRITNPQGIIIFGRDVPQEQKRDFDIIRRKYKNIVDIITYDDLLRRLQMLIKKFSTKKENKLTIQTRVQDDKETI
ncbi:hypothetical protein FACS189494_05620 [Spirochaetia bacterium]|nr:hypothetical protein FACS189494_05620 [Spirochaetia bacterium]